MELVTYRNVLDDVIREIGDKVGHRGHGVLAGHGGVLAEELAHVPET